MHQTRLPPRSLLTDPVFRRWTLGCLRRQWSREDVEYTPHRPPGVDLPDALETPQRELPVAVPGIVSGPSLIGLGAPKRDVPGWGGLETAQRALSALDQARRAGLPAGASALLAQYAQHLCGCLDYWGSRDTTSDLAVEGLALYRLGLELGLPRAADGGCAVLAAEKRRVMAPSGVVREGSTVAQTRLAWVFVDAWLAARRAGREIEAKEFHATAGRLLGVLSILTLPGGLPLMGGSLNLAVDRWGGLLPGGTVSGWLEDIPADEAAAVIALREASRQPDWETIRADGWLRQDVGAWSGLWHISPDGWPETLAHQDAGAAEIHYDGIPVFVDPGDGPEGEEFHFRRAAAHGGLQFDGEDPLPEMRPGYAAAFRRDVAGLSPRLQCEADGVSLSHYGWSRLGGPREARRRWRFSDHGFSIEEFINGTGRFAVTRRLVTPLPATLADDGTVTLALPDGGLKISGDQPAVINEGLYSLRDGALLPAQVIEFVTPKGNLPYRARLCVERL